MRALAHAEMTERLAELKRMDVPRANIARALIGDPDTDPAILAAVEKHLHHFAWLTNDADEPLCPGCESRGYFGWGIVHGAGSCSCGWPGRLYHYIADPDPAAPCRYCGHPPDEHDEEKAGLRCRGGDSAFDHYERRTIARLDQILWAHPYEVTLRAKPHG